MKDSNYIEKPLGLFIDLDGTALSSNEIPNQNVLNSIKLAAKKIPVSLASGRMHEDVSHFARLFGLSYPQISDNGARILDPVSGHVLYEATICEIEAKRIVKKISLNAKFFFAGESGRLLTCVDDINSWKISAITVELRDRIEAQDWCKELSTDRVDGVVSVGSRGEWYANFTKRKINKGTAILKVAEYIEVDARSLMAIGDGSNDLDMFKVVGTSVAMGQSIPEVKQKATFVTGSVGCDGLVDAINKFIL